MCDHCSAKLRQSASQRRRQGPGLLESIVRARAVRSRDWACPAQGRGCAERILKAAARLDLAGHGHCPNVFSSHRPRDDHDRIAVFQTGQLRS